MVPYLQVQTSKNKSSHQWTQQPSQLIQRWCWSRGKKEGCEEKWGIVQERKKKHPKQIKSRPCPSSSLHSLSSSTSYFFTPLFLLLLLCQLILLPHFLSTPPPHLFHFFCQSLSLFLWADRQRQGDCCCACSLTLSAHKSPSTACMSLLLCSLPPLVKEWKNPVTCQWGFDWHNHTDTHKLTYLGR